MRGTEVGTDEDDPRDRRRAHGLRDWLQKQEEAPRPRRRESQGDRQA